MSAVTLRVRVSSAIMAQTKAAFTTRSMSMHDIVRLPRSALLQKQGTTLLPTRCSAFLCLTRSGSSVNDDNEIVVFDKCDEFIKLLDNDFVTDNVAKGRDRFKQPPADGGLFSEVRASNSGKKFSQSKHSLPLADNSNLAAIEEVTDKKAEARKPQNYDMADKFKEASRDDYRVIADNESLTRRVVGGFGPNDITGSRSDDVITSQTKEKPTYTQSSYSTLLFTDSIEDDTQKIRNLIHDRLEARRFEDYAKANKIDDYLFQHYNVSVNDQLRQWSIGGDFGKKDPTLLRAVSPISSDETPLGASQQKAVQTYYKRGDVGNLTEGDIILVEAAVQLYAEELSRSNKKATVAIRASLVRRFDVAVDDQNGSWHVLRREYTLSPSYKRPLPKRIVEARAEIEDLMAERAKARTDGNFRRVCEIRFRLFDTFGIRLIDSTREFTIVERKRRSSVGKVHLSNESVFLPDMKVGRRGQDSKDEDHESNKEMKVDKNMVADNKEERTLLANTMTTESMTEPTVLSVGEVHSDDKSVLPDMNAGGLGLTVNDEGHEAIKQPETDINMKVDSKKATLLVKTMTAESLTEPTIFSIGDVHSDDEGVLPDMNVGGPGLSVNDEGHEAINQPETDINMKADNKNATLLAETMAAESLTEPTVLGVGDVHSDDEGVLPDMKAGEWGLNVNNEDHEVSRQPETDINMEISNKATLLDETMTAESLTETTAFDVEEVRSDDEGVLLDMKAGRRGSSVNDENHEISDELETNRSIEFNNEEVEARTVESLTEPTIFTVGDVHLDDEGISLNPKAEGWGQDVEDEVHEASKQLETDRNVEVDNEEGILSVELLTERTVFSLGEMHSIDEGISSDMKARGWDQHIEDEDRETSKQLETDKSTKPDEEVALTVENTTGESLTKLTVPELKRKLRAVGLPVNGKKAELIVRLLNQK